MVQVIMKPEIFKYATCKELAAAHDLRCWTISWSLPTMPVLHSVRQAAVLFTQWHTP